MIDSEEANRKHEKENVSIRNRLQISEKGSNALKKEMSENNAKCLQVQNSQMTLAQENKVLMNEISELRNENAKKYDNILKLNQEIQSYKEKAVNRENKSGDNISTETFNFKYNCDFCGENFQNNAKLMKHISSVHETAAKENVLIGRIEVAEKIQKLQEKENNNSFVHKCKGICNINHQKFNFSPIRSKLFIEDLRKLKEARFSGNVENGRNTCDITFYNQFVLTQENQS